MKHDELEPPPDILARAFEAERDLVDDDPVTKAAVFRHVERAVSLAAPLTGAPSASTSNTAPPVPPPEAAPPPAAAIAQAAGQVYTAKTLAMAVIGAFAAGSAAGVVVVGTTRTAPPPITTAVAVTDAGVSTAWDAGPTSANTAVVEETSLATARANDVPDGGGATAVVSIASSGVNLARERELIDLGRAALARGNPEVALDAVERHRRQFPGGTLREERDAIRVQALAAARRSAEAERAASQFHRAYPSSLLSETVDMAIAKPPP